MLIGLHVSLGRTQHNETLAVPDEEPAKALARRAVSFFPLRVPSSDLPGRVIANLIRCNRGRGMLKGHAQQQQQACCWPEVRWEFWAQLCVIKLCRMQDFIYNQTIPEQWTPSPRPRERKAIVSDWRNPLYQWKHAERASSFLQRRKEYRCAVKSPLTRSERNEVLTFN